MSTERGNLSGLPGQFEVEAVHQFVIRERGMRIGNPVWKVVIPESAQPFSHLAFEAAELRKGSSQ